ncbi:MFS transporter [Facklamia languida]
MAKIKNEIYTKNVIILALIQIINVFGDDFFNFAAMWIIYRDSRSVFLTSLVGVVWHLSDAIISPISGIVVDRYSKKKVVIVSNISAFIYSLIVFIIIITTGSFPVWLAITSMAVLNCLTSFVSPVRKAIVISDVKKENLNNVNALFSSAVQTSSVLSSSISGIAFSLIGVASCIFLNSLSFLLVIIGFLIFDWKKVQILPSQNANNFSFTKDFLDGIKYLNKNVPLKKICVISMLVNVTSYTGTLFTILIFENFQGNATYLGFFQSIAAIGSIVSGLLIMKLTIKRQDVWLSFSIMIMGILTGLMGYVTNAWIMSMTVFLMYFFRSINGIIVESLFMKFLDFEYAGRVSGLMKTLSISLIPFSTLLAGYLGNVTSVQTMFFFTGVYLTVCGILVIFMINLNAKSKSS